MPVRKCRTVEAQYDTRKEGNEGMNERVRVRALNAYTKRSINRTYHTMQGVLVVPLVVGFILTVGGYTTDTIWVLILGMMLLPLVAAGILSVEMSRRERVRLMASDGWML